MVSFSCENCGDVFTKKKLDSHRSQCRGATFTCLDCMVHFQGTEYRSHTTCISEAQKYQGALYKERKPKNQQHKTHPKSNPVTSNALVPLNTATEGASEAHSGAIAIVNAPPPAPTPPPATSFNVFQFLIPNEASNVPDTPMAEQNGSFSAHAGENAKELVQLPRNQGQREHNERFTRLGYGYGADPVQQSSEQYSSYPELPQPSTGPPASAYITPEPKRARDATTLKKDAPTTKSDKKRKRHQVEDLDLSRTGTQHRDEIMSDAPAILHSGLTGGLDRMLARRDIPPSPDISAADGVDTIMSPIKRSKPSKSGKPHIKERESKSKKPVGWTRPSTNGTVHKSRKTLDDAERDHTRSREGTQPHRNSSSSAVNDLGTARPLKAIEYRPEDTAKETEHSAASGAVVLQKSGDLRAKLFLSLVGKGSDSERGCSVYKLLKRYRKEAQDIDASSGKEDEKELWKLLRLKRNERGETILFC